jgi:hypothetical protein
MRILRPVLVSALLASGIASAGIVNGDFQTGTLSGWTTFSAGNATLGSSGGFPLVASFDTTGGGASLAAAFRTGQTQSTGNAFKGGGIYQDVIFASTDTYTIEAAIAAVAALADPEGGKFELQVDGTVQDSHTFGAIGADTTLRSTLSASVFLTAGVHEIRFFIGRNELESSTTPVQYLDNITLGSIFEPEAVSNPEPASLVLFTTGGLLLVFWRRRAPAA